MTHSLFRSPDQSPDLARTALVSGGTSGIGRATALKLAQQGMKVVITGRDAARAEETLAMLRRDSGNPAVFALIANHAEPGQVLRLAQTFGQHNQRLDVLVNNVGGNFSARKVGEEGFERTWALNHLSYVQLTLILLPLLHASAPARIVNVASFYYGNTIRFDDLQGARNWNGNTAYLQSKLANLLFTYALARRLAGTGLTVNAVNPGRVDTGINRELTGPARWLDAAVFQRLKKTPAQGAAGVVAMASDPAVDGISGRYVDRTRFKLTRPITQDQGLQEQLWRVTLEQLGLNEPDWAALTLNAAGSVETGHET